MPAGRLSQRLEFLGPIPDAYACLMIVQLGFRRIYFAKESIGAASIWKISDEHFRHSGKSFFESFENYNGVIPRKILECTVDQSFGEHRSIALMHQVRSCIVRVEAVVRRSGKILLSDLYELRRYIDADKSGAFIEQTGCLRGAATSQISKHISCRQGQSGYNCIDDEHDLRFTNWLTVDCSPDLLPIRISRYGSCMSIIVRRVVPSQFHSIAFSLRHRLCALIVAYCTGPKSIARRRSPSPNP